MTSSAKRKTYNLDEVLIARARRVLDARTDTETIERALRRVVDDAEIEAALDAMLSKGRFTTKLK
jgi:Arc/MetJ family transcription regulator